MSIAGKNSVFSPGQDILTPHSPSPLAELSQQLADLESKLALLQVVPPELCLEQVLLKREINARCAPILQLPPETLSEIFVVYFVDTPWYSRDGFVWKNGLQLRRSPLLFGMICNAWREIAWSIPRLWSSMRVQLSRRLDPALVEQWLIRSGRAPLSICVYGRDPYYDPYQSIPSQGLAALGFIARHAERWRNIAFFGLSREGYAVLEAIGLGNRLPNLLYLSINIIFWREGVSSSWVNIFSVAPQLREVELFGDDSSMLVLPLNQLTRLTVRNVNVADCFGILRRSPNLIYCAFHDIELADYSEMLHISHLESLELNFVEDDHDDGQGDAFANPIDFLECLTLPALRHLRVSGARYPDASLSELLNFISRSSCMLQTLCLDDTWVDDCDHIDFFHAIPSIHTLSLKNVGELDMTNKALQMLTPNPTSSVLLPNLKILRCTYNCYYPLDLAVLADFLCSRWGYGNSETMSTFDVAQLESVKFDFSLSVDLDARTKDLLQALDEEGMEISLSSRGRTWLFRSA